MTISIPKLLVALLVAIVVYLFLGIAIPQAFAALIALIVFLWLGFYAKFDPRF